MHKVMRIGTRDSHLAIWQANQVKDLLQQHGYASELVFIKSEGDIDLKTPLYEMGVQGIFTRSLDIALLNERIDLAVHSMKDVPTKLPRGIVQSAVLKRGSFKDLLVFNGSANDVCEALGFVDAEWRKLDERSAIHDSRFTIHDLGSTIHDSPFTIATSSIRRSAQWLHRYPHHSVENLRGNVNSRLRKLQESPWNGAIFAAAGLDRIGLRPENSIELDWMLPAPAQGAILIACRESDNYSFETSGFLNDAETATCTGIEKDFLRVLAGGCSTPIGALAQVKDEEVIFKGNIFTVDGTAKAEIEKKVKLDEAKDLGVAAAYEMLARGGQSIADCINHER